VITSTGTQPTVVGRNTGVGAGALFQSAGGNGFAGGTAAPNRYGLSAANTATQAGSGAAMAASGGQNAGVIANTANADQFAIRAANRSADLGFAGAVEALGGTGVGLIAATDVEDVPAIVSAGALVTLGTVVIADPSGLVSFLENGIPVFGASSIESPTVQFSGNALLTASGGASFGLDPDAVEALDLSSAAVVVTPNSGPMPNLWATVSESGQLTITGGTAEGVVSYLVTVPTLTEVTARRAAPDYSVLVDRAREARSV
jgi:hypothetical protein